MKTYDATVIGGGPAGITAAMALARAGASVALAEMIGFGGQLLRQHKVENYPGFPAGIAGWELADLLAAGLEGLPLDHYNAEVSEWSWAPEGSFLVMGTERVQSRAVVLCTGVTPKKLDVPGEARLTGRGVSYCALCDGGFFRDQPVVVVGDDDVALHEALYLAGMVSHVSLICRHDALTAAPRLHQAAHAAANVTILTGHGVVEILGSEMVEGVLVRDEASGDTRKVAAEGVFVFTGYEPQGAFFPAELERDANGFVLTDAEMRTRLEGVFAAGDVRAKQCRQISAATGDGATAAMSVLAFLG